MATHGGFGATAYAASKAGLIGTSCFQGNSQSARELYNGKGERERKNKKQNMIHILGYSILGSSSASLCAAGG